MAKRLTKEDKEHILRHVDGNLAFFLSNGRVISSLSQLAKELEDMHEAVYRYHVNPDNNDFANWVRDVIGDEKLSKDLAKAKTQKGVAKKVAARVAALSG